MLNRRDYISLKKAAEATFCSASFLLKMINEKKLKGFKMGSRWYTTSEWLSDFNRTLKGEISGLANDYKQPEDQHFWQFVKSPLILTFQSALNIALVVMLIVSWGMYVGGLENKSEMVILSKRIIIKMTDSIRENKISDEALTYEWQKLVGAGTGSAWGALGQVAGEFEEYRMNDGLKER